MTSGAAIRSRRAADGQVLGTFLFAVSSSEFPPLIARAGFDFVVIDMEHSIFDLATVVHLVHACLGSGLAPIVRVPSPDDASLIGRVLDNGAAGVMAPMIDSVEAAQRLVATTRYPPRGNRGVGYQQRVSWPDLTATGDPLVIAQIETPRAVEDAASIAAVAGVDVLWVGRRDLSTCLGRPGDYDDPRFMSALRSTAVRANGAGKSAGYLGDDAEELRSAAELGFTWLGLGSDLALYRRATADGIAAYRHPTPVGQA